MSRITQQLLGLMVLAAVAIVGLVGLLLAEGAWREPFLVLAALPLIVGVGLVVYREL